MADFGGDGPPVVLVHGLGGSHVNWVSVAEALTGLGRVTALDLPGFGLTAPAGRPSTMDGARTVLGEYLRTRDAPSLVVGNSMGAIVALMQAAVDPHAFRGLVLVSPAVPFDPRALDRRVALLFCLYFLPGADTVVLRGRRRIQSPEEIARFTLDLCTARVGRIDPDVVRDHIELADRRSGLPGIDRGFVEAARSMLGTLLNRSSFDRLIATITSPTLLIHGRADRLVKVEWVERVASMRPDWCFESLDDVGHVPMLEVPRTTASIITDWASCVPAA